MDSNLRARGSQLYLFEGNSISVLQELTNQLMQKGDRPKLFFNHDVQVQYGIERDACGGSLCDHRQIIDFYKQHNLDCHQGLNNFLQTDGERTDGWMDEYYNYLRQPLHSTPERINTPAIEIDIPQLTFIQLKQKYSQFWERENTYFKGGESQATATLDSFLDSRFHGYH